MFNLGLEAISAALILCVKSPQKLETYVLLLRSYTDSNRSNASSTEANLLRSIFF